MNKWSEAKFLLFGLLLVALVGLASDSTTNTTLEKQTPTSQVNAQFLDMTSGAKILEVIQQDTIEYQTLHQACIITGIPDDLMRQNVMTKTPINNSQFIMEQPKSE